MYELNVYKSIGPGGTHVSVLRELVDIIAGPLSILCQSSWESGEVLCDWKLAKIVYICKKTEDHGNYRPVSLTSVPGKMMEKISLGANEKQLKDSNSHQTRYH